MSNSLRHNESSSIIPQPTYEKTPIHLTRRGRRVLGSLGLALTVAALFGASKGVDAANPDYTFSDTTVTEIADRGDTVWGFAKKIDGVDQVDIRTAVDYLEETNPGLADGLQEGESVVRPVSIDEE